MNTQPTGVDIFGAVNVKNCKDYVLSMQYNLDNAVAKDDVDTIRSIVHRMICKSTAVRVVAVDRITRINNGKKTAGIDGVKLDNRQSRDVQKRWRMKVLESIDINAKPQAIRRVYMPKANGKQRPLGIPTIHDRVVQAIVKMAIEPICEFHFSDRSHGFRPNRCTMDAITDIWKAMVKLDSQRWVLEGDIKNCFDNLDHQHILNTLSQWRVPKWTTGIIERMLKSKIMENLVLTDVADGTPQGGVISPLLANVALDALDKHMLEVSQWKSRNIRDQKNGGRINPIIRYADDFVVISKNKTQAQEYKEQITEFLLTIGVEISDEKTKITHVNDGFDFLGFNLRRYESKGKHQSSVKGKTSPTTLLITPQKEKVQAHRDKFKATVKSSGSMNQKQLIKKLNPIIRGFCNYYKGVSAKNTFGDIQHFHWHTLQRWAERRHQNKNPHWTNRRYFHVRDGKKAWFGDKEHNLWLYNPARVPIKRHPYLKSGVRVFNLEDAEYWIQREFDRAKIEVDGQAYRLFTRQDGICEVCGDQITKTDLDQKMTHTHHIKPKKFGGDWKLRNLRLIHSECHKELHSTYSLQEMSDLADAGEEYWKLNIIFV